MPANAGDISDTGSIPGSGRSPRVGNGNPLQYSYLKNSRDRGNLWVTVHGVTESDTTEQLNTHICVYYIYVCAVLCLVTQSCPTLCNSMDSSPPGSSVHGDSPGKHTGVGCHTLLQGIFPTQEIEPRSLSLQADSLLSDPPGKPINTGMGSLSLLQGIFPTQVFKPDLLHCRQIFFFF